MKRYSLAIALAATLAGPAIAHPEHDEMSRMIVQKSIPEKAQDAVLREITRAKLHASWRDATVGEPALLTKGGAPRWVVPFRNPAVKKASQRTLYVLLTQGGEFVATSYNPR